MVSLFYIPKGCLQGHEGEMHGNKMCR